jgi:beta-1,4-mannosyl-glycoprotein beta-1,4-N-acetylglucosaminyltransferase
MHYGDPCRSARKVNDLAIFDVFPFHNEMDILELRLNTLDPFVDYFVIGQSDVTFSGLSKPFHFNSEDPRFAKFAPKIIEHRLTTDIAGDPFRRDAYQKDSIRSVLDSICQSKDVVIFSDVDELPNPRVLDRAIYVASSGTVAHLAQHLHYYYLDLREVSGTLLSYSGEFPGVQDKKWLGTKVVTFEDLGTNPLSHLRSPTWISRGQRIAEGGWHFSYVGGLDDTNLESRVRDKIRDFAHQELNTTRNKLLLKRRLNRGIDPFGRRDARFERVEIDETFPDFLRRNLDRYAHLLYS